MCKKHAKIKAIVTQKKTNSKPEKKLFESSYKHLNTKCFTTKVVTIAW